MLDVMINKIMYIQHSAQSLAYGKFSTISSYMLVHVYICLCVCVCVYIYTCIYIMRSYVYILKFIFILPSLPWYTTDVYIVQQMAHSPFIVDKTSRHIGN